MKLIYKNYIKSVRIAEIKDEEKIFQDVLNITKKENNQWTSGLNL